MPCVHAHGSRIHTGALSIATVHLHPGTSHYVLNRFLIPLDGEPQAEAALDCALAMSRRNPSEITLTTVASAGAAGQDNAEGRRAASVYLEGVRNRFELPPSIGAVVRVGDPASEILAEARESRSELILIPDRSSGGRATSDLGRVTSRILLGSPVPVLLVRQPPLDAGAAQDILVMLDGSRLAEEAVQPAAHMARLCGGRLILATVITAESHQFGNLPGRWDATSSDEELAERYLRRLTEQPALQDLDVSIEVVRDEITSFLGHIERVANTIVVLTTRGASGFSRWVLGGVADRVSRESPAATMVVPPRMA